jgi:hypothetical protein
MAIDRDIPGARPPEDGSSEAHRCRGAPSVRRRLQAARGFVKVVFLTLDEAIALHADQIERYGGRPGIRDLSRLQSALGVPSATFEGPAVFVQRHLRIRREG